MIEIGKGHRIVTHAVVHIGSADVSIGMRWVKANDLCVIGQGLIECTFLTVGDSPIVICQGILRVEPDRFCIIADRQVKIAQQAISISSVVVENC